jgi:hypothetical protein
MADWRDGMVLREPSSPLLHLAPDQDFSGLMDIERNARSLHLGGEAANRGDGVFAQPEWEKVKHTSLGYVLESRRNPVEEVESNEDSPRDPTLPRMSNFFPNPAADSGGSPAIGNRTSPKKEQRHTFPFSYLRSFLFHTEPRSGSMPRNASGTSQAAKTLSSARSASFISRFRTRSKTASTL